MEVSNWWFCLFFASSGNDGTVYVGPSDTYVYALNPDGSLKWKYQTDGIVSFSPVVEVTAQYMWGLLINICTH